MVPAALGPARDEVRVEANRLIEYQKKVDNSWRGRRERELVDMALMTGYQIALWRTLGPGINSMGQMLQSEVGELLIEILDRLTGQEMDFKIDDAGKLIKEAFERLGIAREIRVERLSDEVKYGRKMRRYRVEIKDSAYMPIHMTLVERGLKEFPLSPEALLAAAIIRKMIRAVTGDGKARVKVTALLPASPGEPLTLLIDEILPAQ